MAKQILHRTRTSCFTNRNLLATAQSQACWLHLIITVPILTGEINYQPYDKWIRSLKEQILNEDGYLIDMSVNLRNIDRGAFRAARDELDKNWSSYYSKYPIE